MPTRLEVAADGGGGAARPVPRRLRSARARRRSGLIDGGRVRVDGAARPEAPPRRGGRGRRGRARGARDAGRRRRRPVRRSRYEDEHLLVVDKPAGVVVHPARGHRGATLAEALAGRAAGGEDPARAGIVHRLDRDTSGLLVVAKSDEAHRALQEAIRERTVRREYLALVEGCPPARSGTIDAPIGRDRRVRTRMSTRDRRAARGAHALRAGARASAARRCCASMLETGRTHQIRVHLQAIGHPVAGDPEYGTAGRSASPRQFLHAARLAFDASRHGRADRRRLAAAAGPRRRAGAPDSRGERRKCVESAR